MKNSESPKNSIKVRRSAYKTMMGYAEDHPKKEVLGIFFGTIEKNHTVVVEKSYPFRVGGSKEVDFLDEDYVRAVPLIRENEGKGLRWLGWFHSHPFTRGDHIYMSNKDVRHQKPAQSQNPYWTAIVINPYQINDPATKKGMRAYRLKEKRRGRGLSSKVLSLDVKIID